MLKMPIFSKKLQKMKISSVIFLKLICIGKRWVTVLSTQCHHKPRSGKKIWKTSMIWRHWLSQNAENANFFKKITKNWNFFCNFLEINLHWEKIVDCSQYPMASQTKNWKENLKNVNNLATPAVSKSNNSWNEVIDFYRV